MTTYKTLKYLQINNLSLDFSSIFSKVMSNLEVLDLKNLTTRKKPLDENELKSFYQHCPNISSLFLIGAIINERSLKICLPNFKSLSIKNAILFLI